MERRNITPTVAAHLGMVEMRDRMRIVIPYRDARGQMVWWNARAYSNREEGPKYLGAPGRHPLYVLPSWRPARDVVLVEGALDAIAVWTYIPNVTVAALGGKSLPRYNVTSLRQLCAGRLHVMLDSDALGSALTLQNRLRTFFDVRVVVLPDGEDPSSMGEKLREVW